jgi:hypothetical protein
MPNFYAGQGAPVDGTSGTRAGDAYFGDFYYDKVNAIEYQNTSIVSGSPTWTALADTFTTNISVGGTLAVTGAATLSSTLAVTGVTTLTGKLVNTAAPVYTPDAGQTVTAASTIAVDAGLVLVNSASALTITAHPAIATSGVSAGTRITIKNTNASNAITLTDDGTDSGSKIKVRTSTTIALSAGLTFDFVFDGTNWIVT